MDENQNINIDEIEIDFNALFTYLKALWYTLLIGFIVGTILSIGYVGFIKKPTYLAESKVYLRNGTKKISIENLQVGQQLSKDYEVIFLSRPNLEAVINSLNLDMTVDELNSKITVTSLENTRIIQIEVKDHDSLLAKKIANKLVNEGIDRVKEIDSQEPYVVEKAIEPANPIGMSNLLIVVLGSLIGLIVTLGGLVVRFIIRDSIDTIDTLENSLNTAVLAVIPEDKRIGYRKRGAQH